MAISPTAAGAPARASNNWLGALLALCIGPFLLLGALHGAPAATGVPVGPPPPATPSPSALAATSNASRAGGSEPDPQCVDRFLAPLDPSGAQSNSSASEPETWAVRVGAAAGRARQALSDPEQLDALIATVPDPIDSGSGYGFDSGLQALRLGMETQLRGGHSLFRDQSFLPWAAGSDSPAEQKAAENCRERTPGIVTFRSGDPNEPRLVVVLLVGETPTTGVHRFALLNAIRAVELLTRPSQRGAREPLRLLGPSFSGSAYSIRRTLRDWREEAPDSGLDEVNIVTGSASGGSLRQTLASERGQPDAWFSNGAVHFSSTTVPEARLECRYLWFLKAEMGEAKSFATGAEPQRLDNVALLHESGTEFGSTLAEPASGNRATAACGLRVGIDLSFPAHISALREAYEDMDRKAEPHPEAVARSTALDVSLREKSSPRGMDAEPSPKMTYASDVSVSRILAAIARTTIRHVLIRATDVADAIFLARKIRDVAPDVRLAFSRADVLLLHPTFQRDLFGSIVVTPYPFLGSSDFVTADALAREASSASRHREGFENDATEGVFNAALALRGASTDELREYAPLSGYSQATDSGPILPVWLAAIGHDSFIPLLAGPSDDKADGWQSDVIYRGSAKGSAPPAVKPLGRAPGNWEDRWLPFGRVQLLIADNVVLPRLWRFLMLALGIGFVVDRVRQQRVALSLSDSSVPNRVHSATDGDADRSIVRTKWKLYAAVRTFVLAAAFSYMAVFWILAGFVHHAANRYVMCVALSAGICVLGFYCAKATRAFAEDYFAFAESAECRTPWLFLAGLISRARAVFSRASSGQAALGLRAPSTPPEAGPNWIGVESDAASRWDRWTLWIGVARADVDISPAKLSFAQLRLLANLALLIATLFVVFQTLALYWSMELPTGETAQLMRVLLVARSLQLLDGLSPAAPTLLCLGVVYVWAVGRMSRLRVVHSLSQLSPADEVLDLVSTPIRLVLYPNFPGLPEDKVRQSDDSFPRVERRAVNSIVRPITGPQYCLALAVVMSLPFGLFWLNPLSTLEISWGTWLLYLGLFLCSALIGNTIIQLFQYWEALQLLLKTVFQHRLGRSFSQVAPFVREPLHDQVSRTPHDVLRLGACATQFDDLVRTARMLPEAFRRVGWASQQALNQAQAELRDARQKAIVSSNSHNIAVATRAEEHLGRLLIVATRQVSALLHQVWDGSLASPPAPPRAGEREHGQRTSSGPTTKRGEGFVETAIPSLPLPPSDLWSGTKRVASQARFFGSKLPTEVLAAQALHSAPEPLVDATVPEPPPGSFVPLVSLRSEPAHRDSPSEAFAPEAWRYGKNERHWVKNAESFAATVVALLINRHVRQLDYFVYTLLTSALLLMVAALSYPFEPHRLMLTWIWCLVLVAAGSGLWIYVELDRNSLLSRIARTNPGELTFNREFALRVITWGIVPLTAAAATQYPALANTIARIVTPFGAH